MKKTVSKVGWVSILLICGLSSVVWGEIRSPKKAYYGSSFYHEVSAGLKNDQLKRKLKTILTSAHIPQEDGPDLIQSSCSKTQTQETLDDAPSDSQEAMSKKSKSCYRHRSYTYNQARRFLFGRLHLERTQGGNYAVTSVYCRKKVTEGQVGPGKIPNHQIINAEHTWPQSRFNKSQSHTLQKSDLHALYPALSKVNSSRGNLELAWVDQPVGTPPCDGVYRGHNNSSGNKLYFEPRDDHKGDAARALFYFSTRYNLKIASTEEQSLREWHQLDPVDAIERERHEEVFEMQKVRNPFIDHPELADLIRDF